MTRGEVNPGEVATGRQIVRDPVEEEGGNVVDRLLTDKTVEMRVNPRGDNKELKGLDLTLYYAVIFLW